MLSNGTRHPRSQPTKYLREHHSAYNLPTKTLVDGGVPSEDATHKGIFGLNVCAMNATEKASVYISLGDTVLVTRRVDRTNCFKK